MKRMIVLVVCLGLFFVIIAGNVFAAATATDGDDKGQVGSLSQKMAIVPNVVGMPYRTAITAIQNAGFSAKANGTEPLSVKVKKTVASQSPAAGKSAFKGSFVVVNLR